MKKEIIEVDQSKTWIGHAVKTYLDAYPGLEGGKYEFQANHYTDHFFKEYIALLDLGERSFEAKEIILNDIRNVLEK